MKSNAHKVFAVLLLATFSVWVGCSHNAPPELSNRQRELNEKENEITAWQAKTACWPARTAKKTIN